MFAKSHRALHFHLSLKTYWDMKANKVKTICTILWRQMNNSLRKRKRIPARRFLIPIFVRTLNRQSKRVLQSTTFETKQSWNYSPFFFHSSKLNVSLFIHPLFHKFLLCASNLEVIKLARIFWLFSWFPVSHFFGRMKGEHIQINKRS